jgi:hypothetical protein
MSCCKKNKSSNYTDDSCKSGNVLDCLAFLNCKNGSEIFLPPCDEDQAIQNWAKLADALKALCCIKNAAFPKETTLARFNGDAPSGTQSSPVGAPSNPKKGDIHTVQYNNGTIVWTFNGSQWIISGGNLKQRLFVDNIIAQSTIPTTFNFNGLEKTDFDVYWNGQKIYWNGEQTATGVVVWDVDFVTGVFSFYDGALGTNPGDLAILGLVDNPCYIEIKVSK